MPRRFVKASKRSARAIGNVFNKGAKRVETLMALPTVNANDLANAVSGQWFDMMDAWMNLFGGGGDGAPTEFLDARLPGPGGSLVVNRTATLDDTITFTLLQTTPMTAPGSANTLTMTLAAVPATATEVEQILITVNVPNSTTPGLYRGFVFSAENIQVEIFVSVH
jgi:hypothetical protein